MKNYFFALLFFATTAHACDLPKVKGKTYHAARAAMIEKGFIA